MKWWSNSKSYILYIIVKVSSRKNCRPFMKEGHSDNNGSLRALFNSTILNLRSSIVILVPERGKNFIRYSFLPLAQQVATVVPPSTHFIFHASSIVLKQRAHGFLTDTRIKSHLIPYLQKITTLWLDNRETVQFHITFRSRKNLHRTGKLNVV